MTANAKSLTQEELRQEFINGTGYKMFVEELFTDSGVEVEIPPGSTLYSAAYVRFLEEKLVPLSTEKGIHIGDVSPSVKLNF